MHNRVHVGVTWGEQTWLWLEKWCVSFTHWLPTKVHSLCCWAGEVSVGETWFMKTKERGLWGPWLWCEGTGSAASCLLGSTDLCSSSSDINPNTWFVYPRHWIMTPPFHSETKTGREPAVLAGNSSRAFRYQSERKMGLRATLIY